MRYLPLLSLAWLFFFGACRQNPPAPYPGNGQTEVGPAPTEIAAQGEEEGSDQGAGRLRWMEEIHRAAPNVAWREIESANAVDEVKRLRARTRHVLAKGGLDSLAPGLQGHWTERGSNNLAGSVLATAYDALTDQLYTISAGGTLWRGPSDGSTWTVVDQSRRYEQRALKLIERSGPSRRRLLAAVDRQVVLSDDGGGSWQTATGISVANNAWSATWDFTLSILGTDTTLYLLSTAGYYDPVELYASSDLGERWTLVTATGLGLRDSDIDLVEDPSRGAPWLLAEAGLSRVTNSGLTFVSSPPDNTESRRLTAAAQVNGDIVLYTYDTNLRVHRSTDAGSTWETRGRLTNEPWNVGLFVNPDDPDELVAGAVNAAVSRDGGMTWKDVNNWSDYYGNIARYLHADMMTFGHYRRRDGSTFSVSANHGGLYRTSNFFVTSQNIGLAGLNVGQFYSVVSHAAHPGWIFGGTQDQGFQRGLGVSDDDLATDFEQAISGDYGHLSFSADGRKLWMVYPGTDISYYRNPRSGSRTASRTIESADETVWLAPLVTHPDPAQNAVLVAGGSVEDDATGSFVLVASADDANRDILIEELPFDFKANSGSVLTALGTSPLSTTRIYAATDQGKFFTSDNTGQTWTEANGTFRSGHYLYGQAIEASPVAANTVWLGGSGYSNPGVYRSEDGGLNFRPDSRGLPKTMVFELAASADGVWLFAATEAGPYGLHVATRQWYPLALPGVPTQTFWSVDYVPEDSLVRFGTYGRGIWDLKLSRPQQPPSAIYERGNSSELALRLSPNPVRDRLQVELMAASSTSLQILDLQAVDPTGRQVTSLSAKPAFVSSTSSSGQSVYKAEVDVSTWPAGTYFLTVRTNRGAASKALVIRR